MPYRKTKFSNGEIYHLINRGVAQNPIFLVKQDYQRFLELIDFYRFNPPVRFSYYKDLSVKAKIDFTKTLKINYKPVIEILAFCLMSNHFHLLLKQLSIKGIHLFMNNFQNSYARYFNIKK